MRKLYIARHGETDYNLENRYAGTIDIPLNETGIEQSRTLAQYISHLPIDIIVCSSKKRAFQTAEIINKFLKKPLCKNDLLIERNLGIYEGLTRNEAAKQYPKLWAKKVLHENDNHELKGESVNDVKKRAKKAIKKILEEYEGMNILVVTHGYVSRMIHGILTGIPKGEKNDFLLANCQVTEYEVE